MAEIDIEEVKKKASKKKEEERTIKATVIDGVTYFHSSFLNKDFTDYGEANKAESEARLKEEYKKQGLNEFGQSPEDAEKSVKIKALIEKKAKILKEIQAIDLEIAQVKRPKAEVKEAKEESKVKKK